MCVSVRLCIRGFICNYTYEFQREKEGRERGSAEEGERKEVKNSRMQGGWASIQHVWNSPARCLSWHIWGAVVRVTGTGSERLVDLHSDTEMHMQQCADTAFDTAIVPYIPFQISAPIA